MGIILSGIILPYTIIPGIIIPDIIIIRRRDIMHIMAGRCPSLYRATRT